VRGKGGISLAVQGTVNDRQRHVKVTCSGRNPSSSNSPTLRK
jgi:hypothetical protein